MNATRRSRAEEKAELAMATAALDSRKAVTKKPKLYKQLREEATSEPTAARAKGSKPRKSQDKPKDDIMKRGRRVPGSGWAGKRQK